MKNNKKYKNIYGLIAICLIFGVYGYEYFKDNQASTSSVERGTTYKVDTNTFLLPASTTDQVIHHNYYSLSYSEPHEQAEWVAYELKKDHLSSARFQRPYFEVDLAVKTGAAHWRNYKNSSYDKGHLCPAGDRRFSKDAYDETFLTSNISPQNPEFNAGVWNALEQKVRYWAQKYDGVYVVTGGVLKDDLEHIGSERVTVPKQFYKIVYDYQESKPKMIAFLMANENSTAPLHAFVVTVDSIQKLTGIDFFPELEDGLEQALETQSDIKAWHLN